VRMALGATTGDIKQMVLKSALAMLVVGLVLGTPAAFWSRRFAAAMIQNLPVTDPRPIAFAVLAMTVVAFVAAYLPARRAARVRPVEGRPRRALRDRRALSRHAGARRDPRPGWAWHLRCQGMVRWT